MEIMWECQWRDLKAKSEALTCRVWQIRHDAAIFLPLNSRDALYGGRTCASSILFPALLDLLSVYESWVEALDFNSLYPWVMKYCDYPFRHPTVLVGSGVQFDYTPGKYFGLMGCEMDSPKRLLFPVLPARVEDADGCEKLVFLLCARCARERRGGSCTHSREDRRLTGTWFTEEIYAAVARGYTIHRITCVWDYGQCHRKGLFAQFVNKFYKLKTEASGYPDDCITDQDKADYIRDFEKGEGIALDPDKIQYNPARRSGCKLLLNSCWGKWVQRTEDRTTTKFFHSPVTFHKF